MPARSSNTRPGDGRLLPVSSPSRPPRASAFRSRWSWAWSAIPSAISCRPRSLRSVGLRGRDRRVLVVGAGGAAKAVVDVLVREGARVQVTNRTMRRADVLADSFDESVEAIPLDALARGGPWDLLVNATPLGTREAGPGLPVPASILPKVAHVYDLVYNPPTTPLLEAARRLGKPTTSGLEMLLHQAAQSFELWTGRAPPVEPMRRVAKEALG